MEKIKTEKNTNWFHFSSQIRTSHRFLAKEGSVKKNASMVVKCFSLKATNPCSQQQPKKERGDIFCANLGTIYTIICDNKFRGTTSDEEHKKVLCFAWWFRANMGKAFHSNWRAALKVNVAWEMFDDGVRTLSRGMDWLRYYLFFFLNFSLKHIQIFFNPANDIITSSRYSK